MSTESAEKHDGTQGNTSGCSAETDLTKLMQLRSADSVEKQCNAKQYIGVQYWDKSK